MSHNQNSNQPSIQTKSDISQPIMHVDINSYFATMLQQENPYLRGKPIGVVKEIGRSCIIAASKEAKKQGVGTGSSLADALHRCPELQQVAATFDRYLAVTKRLRTIFASVSPDYYIYSLDEAFIDLTHCQRLYTSSYDVGKQIQQAIKDELGQWVTCNVGLSHNRLLAKMASEIADKGSLLTITEDNKDYYLASVGFEDVCGIGYRLSKKLKLLGVTTPYQIRFYSEDELRIVFGPFWAKELLRIAYGQDSHNLTLTQRTLPHMKSVSRSITGHHATNDESEIRRVLYNLTEEVTYKARRMNLAGRYVSISLYGTGSTHYGFNHIAPQETSWRSHQTLKQYINSTDQMFTILYDQLYGSWQRSFKVVKFVVRLSLLKPSTQIDQSLLPSEHKRQALNQALDSISNRYGLFTVKSGRMAEGTTIRPEVTGFLGDREYQFEHG